MRYTFLSVVGFAMLMASAVYANGEKSGPDLGRMAELLGRETGLVWKANRSMMGTGAYISTAIPRADNNNAHYLLLPFPLDDAGRAKLIVLASNSSNVFTVLGANEQYTLLTNVPGDDRPERQAKILAVLKLKPSQFEPQGQPGKEGWPVNPDAFRLDLIRYNASHEAEAGLTLSVTPLDGEKSPEGWLRVRITKDQAKAVLDALNRHSVFSTCSARPEKGSWGFVPAQSLVVVLRGYVPGVVFYGDVDSRKEAIEAMRQSLGGEAARAFASLETRAATTSPAK